jgi:8-oxo-dGTP pyrophosphatase MutT (NUDIX family)
VTRFEPLGERLIHEGHAIDLVVATFRAPDGSEIEREVVHHPGAVSVVPIIDRPAGPAAVMVRQFRAALGADLLEIPAGKRDVQDEPAEETAQRELAEEVGLAAGRLVQLAEFHNSAGFSDERSFVFLGLDLTPVPSDRQGVEEEHMTIEEVPLADVPGLIDRGELTDAKSIIGLLLALRHLGR